MATLTSLLPYPRNKVGLVAGGSSAPLGGEEFSHLSAVGLAPPSFPPPPHLHITAQQALFQQHLQHQQQHIQFQLQQQQQQQQFQQQFQQQLQLHQQPPQPLVHPKVTCPPYGQRQGWIPRTVADFGDGGAFPEIHVAQYPLDMGRKKADPSGAASATVPISVDNEGKIKYDSIITRETNNHVFSKFSDTVPSMDANPLQKPDIEVETATTEKTRAALEKIVNGKIKAARPAAPMEKQKPASYIRYTPAQQADSFNSGASSRIIRMIDMPKDPLEPPKFKHKKVPRGPPSPPVPVMHSPPTKVTAKEQQEWKIPPCISNWKNPKGYTIPLDKRLAADGRGLQQVQINDNFAKLSEALYIAERSAREEVAHRAAIRERIARREKEAKEILLRECAQNTRKMRMGGGRSAGHEESEEVPHRSKSSSNNDDGVDGNSYEEIQFEEPGEDETPSERAAREERDRLREERRRDRERERRLEHAHHHNQHQSATMATSSSSSVPTGTATRRSKAMRDGDRDVTEKIALGERPNIAGASSGETLYDQRLFNQIQGISSGFSNDEAYDVYDKPLFQGSSMGMLYRPKKNADNDSYGDSSDPNDISSLKPHRTFTGADTKADPRSRPVEFEVDKRGLTAEEEEDDSDPFKLDEFLHQAKTSASGKKKNPLDVIGKGHLHAASTSSFSSETNSFSTKRTIDFESKGKDSLNENNKQDTHHSSSIKKRKF